MKRFFAILLAAVLLMSMIPTASMAAQTATVIDGWLRLRSAPNFNADTITSYYTGTVVDIISQSGSWYRVKTPDGRTGYMYGKYLTFGSYTPSGSGDAYVTSYNGYGVRMRTGPGTGYRIIRTYDVGTPVTVLQQGSYWCKISINGTTGYMMTKFLNFGSSSSAPSYSVVGYATIWSRNGYGVRLRTGPGTNYSKIGTYSVGTTVEILERGSVWDRIRVGSRIGYMMNEFLYYHSANAITSVTLNTLAPSVGDVLSVQAIAPAGATYTGEWYVGGVYAGTGSTYTVKDADVNKSIQLKVIGNGSYSGTAWSPLTNAVVPNTQVRGVTLNNQTPVVGTVLKATVTPSNATATFSWKAGTEARTGTDTYTVTAADLGKVISVAATGSGSFTGTATASTAAVRETYAIASVSITSNAAGAPALGNVLTASISPSGVNAAYQWYRDDTTAISGATSATYTVTAEDAGKYLSVKVTGISPYTGSATFKMAEQVAGTYAVMVNGKSTNSYAQGAAVTVTAPAAPAGQAFAGWTVVSPATLALSSATSATTSFTMPASPVSLTANYQNVYSVLVNDAVVATHAKDATVTVTAPEVSGQTFAGWTVVSPSSLVLNGTGASVSFTMPGETVKLTATYQPVSGAPTTYAVKVNGTTIDNYAKDATVTLTAPAGQQFVSCTATTPTGLTIHVNGATASFTMPGEEVVLMATYQPVPATTYAVTLNGEAKGDYAKDAIVTLTAPAGQQFTSCTATKPTGLSITVSGATVSFTMPGEAVELTAAYQDIPATTYTVTVNGASIGSYAKDAPVTLTAPAEQEFVSCTATKPTGLSITVNGATASFIMPDEAVELTAAYQNIAPSTYTVTVNGEVKGNYEAGANVSVSVPATASGQNFIGWANETTPADLVLSSRSNPDISFTMPADNVVLTAEYETLYTVTVNGENKGSYAAGTTVSVSAPAPTTPGQKFIGWAAETTPADLVLSSRSNPDISFTMPESNVVLKANYETVYSVTVNGENKGSYAAGTTVSVSAPAPTTPGQKFIGWAAETTPADLVLSSRSNPDISFTMPAANVVLTADYETMYTVTVNGENKGSYAAGAGVTVTAPTAPEGQAFVTWENGAPADLVLSSRVNTTTSFTMPAQNVELTARFE